MLTKSEKQYLSKFQCLLCEQPLDKDVCGAIYAKKCSAKIREQRRQECLKTRYQNPNVSIPELDIEVGE